MSLRIIAVVLGLAAFSAGPGAPHAQAQIAPSADEIGRYGPLQLAAHRNDAAGIARAVAGKANLEMRDRMGRTAVHIAAHASAYEAMRALKKNGADMRAKDSQSYDAITIAAVKDDVRMVKLAIELGGDPAATTSPYDGTALIAAAHLGHDEVVKALIAAGAPLDHINNLHWTALMEAVVLGDGGPRHVETVRALVKAGASKSIKDSGGQTPLENAKQRQFKDIIKLLE